MSKCMGFLRKAGKILSILAISTGVAMFGCSGQAERSQTTKDQFKNISETEANLLKGKGKGRGNKKAGALKSIKGKLADIEKEKTEGQ